MSGLLYVVVYTKGDKMLAHKRVAWSEAEAGAMQAQVAHMHNAPAWIMAFPAPLEIANEDQGEDPPPSAA